LTAISTISPRFGHILQDYYFLKFYSLFLFFIFKFFNLGSKTLEFSIVFFPIRSATAFMI
jgi:hypothetical protein